MEPSPSDLTLFLTHTTHTQRHSALIPQPGCTELALTQTHTCASLTSLYLALHTHPFLHFASPPMPSTAGTQHGSCPGAFTPASLRDSPGPGHPREAAG